MSDFPLRPLGIIKNLADAMALDITYVYEDLVFLEHNAFLLQMSSTLGEDLVAWFNTESNEDERHPLLVELQQTARRFGLMVYAGGTFTLTGNDKDQTFELKFHTN